MDNEYREVIGRVTEGIYWGIANAINTKPGGVIDSTRFVGELIELGLLHWEPIRSALGDDKELDKLDTKTQMVVLFLRNKYKIKAKKYRPGYIYVIHGDGYYKIGRSKSPNKRMSYFHTALPFETKPIMIIKCDDYVFVESELHNIFKHKRVRGKWFCLSQPDLDTIACCGINVLEGVYCVE